MPHCIVVVSTMVHLGLLVDYIDLVYHVSPPGDERARMVGMKLQFQFQGKEGGKVKVWWNHPRKYIETIILTTNLNWVLLRSCMVLRCLTQTSWHR